MADWVRDLIKDRRLLFKNEGRQSTEWKSFKKKIAAIVKRRKGRCFENVMKKLDQDNECKFFYKHVNALTGVNQKPRWSPRAMYPDKEDKEIAETLAEFFNNISAEYQPLDMNKIPTTFDELLPVLRPEDVAERLLKCKKTSSVPGDLNPRLYNKFSKKLSIPITRIFNHITLTQKWPKQWKTEVVTVIPKRPNPDNPGECRKLSCTNLLSKVYEGFVLEWARKTVQPKLNQYGGEKAAGSTHLLIKWLTMLQGNLKTTGPPPYYPQ